jgi:hypothetical protein
MQNPYIKRAVETLITAVIAAAVLFAAAYGFTVTTVAPLVAETQAEGRGSVTRFNTDVQFLKSITVSNALTSSDLAATDDLTVGDDLTVTDALSAASLTVGGYAQSGSVRFGTASNVISGTTIAHGFATTPTVFIVQNAVIQAATYTQTIYAYGCGTVSCTVGLTQGSVVTITTANWMAGK